MLNPVRCAIQASNYRLYARVYHFNKRSEEKQITTQITEHSIPSHLKGLLRSLIGRKLINIIKFNNIPEKQLIEDYYMTPDEFLSEALGPTLFYFEGGLVVGGGSDPSRNTVLMWVERNEIGEHCKWLQEEDKRAIPFYAKDFDEWKIYLNQVVKSVTIIKEIPDSDSRKLDLPNERGVLIKFENGSDFIMAHGLHDCSDSESLIKITEINPYFRDRLEFIPVKKI